MIIDRPAIASMLASLVIALGWIPAHAAVYDLSTDWSDTSNPNGTWTYADGAGPITVHQTNYATSVGFAPGQQAWAYAADGQGVIASWFKTTSEVNVASNIDYVPGDVISGPWTTAFSGQPGHGPSSVVTWTNPSAAVVSIGGFTWQAHLGGGQNVSWALMVNNTTLDSGVLSPNPISSRSSPTNFSALGLSLGAGDVVSFAFTETPNLANWAGLSLTITTAPVPEPERFAMLLAGLVAIGAIARHRRVR